MSATGGHTATLAYDPLGRLWQVEGPLGTTRFEYDGDRLIEEFNTDGAWVRLYAWGPNVDEPLVWYEATGGPVRRFLHADHQGSVIAVTDDYGNPLLINGYDAWGIPNAANGGRFQYTGQAWLPEFGLYYYKARIYSPTLGRFLQTDPIGYKDQVNLYAYVGNDPVDGLDPTGTDGYYVTRPVNVYGLHVGDHAFIVIADKPGARPKAEYHYGPQYSRSYFNSGKLVSLTNTNSDTFKVDRATWASLKNGRDPSIHIARIPASDKAVQAAGDAMDKFLGTLSKPGSLPYDRQPDGGTYGANSNSAATTVASSAMQNENHGTAFTPPPGSDTVGSDVKILKNGCVKGPGSTSCPE